MKNKLIVTIQFIFVILISCDNKTTVEEFENGSPKLDCELVDGLRTGQCIEYFPNGEVRGITTWLRDTLHGKALIYYESGQLRQEVFWEKGKINGVRKIYYENGELKQVSRYVNGELEGKDTEQYEDGTVARISEWITARDITFINTETKFNQQGDTTYQSHYAVIKAASDTVFLGAPYTFELELKHPIYKKMEVIIGDFDEQFYLRSARADTLNPEGFRVQHSVVPKELGLQRIRGIVKDYETVIHEKGGSKTTFQPYYFEHTYYVVSESEI